jgi:two-component system phosphate regulon sensor histidine kinase PhoR
MIERQCGRLEALVADLLDLSRLESPTGRFTTESMSPGALLDEWNRDYEENVLSKGLDWVVDLPHDMPDVIVNPHLLRLVLDNLVQNAVKFTEKGHVAIRGSHTFREIIISVEDTGCGIPIQDQSRVFERFYQVEKSRKSDRPGTGLGLSIVRHAVAAMNGRIQLKSKPGSGSTFVIYIPRPLEGDSAPPLTQPEHLPPVTTKSSHS